LEFSLFTRWKILIFTWEVHAGEHPDLILEVPLFDSAFFSIYQGCQIVFVSGGMTRHVRRDPFREAGGREKVPGPDCGRSSPGARA